MASNLDKLAEERGWFDKAVDVAVSPFKKETYEDAGKFGGEVWDKVKDIAGRKNYKPSAEELEAYQAASGQQQPQPDPGGMSEPELGPMPDMEEQEMSRNVVDSFFFGDDEAGKKNLKSLIMAEVQKTTPMLSTKNLDMGTAEAQAALQTSAQTAFETAEELTNKALEIQASMPEEHMKALQEAKSDTKAQLDRAQFVLDNGYDEQDFAERAKEIDVMREAGDEAGVLEAEAKYKEDLAKAKQRFGKPDPRRLWNNAAGWQQALFIALNAIGGAAAAVGGGKTPLDVLNDMMEKDYQAQKDDYLQQQSKVGEARSAYSLAARMTDNAIQQELMAKNLMVQGIKMEIQGYGAQVQAAALDTEAAKLQAGMMQNNQQIRSAEKRSNLAAALTLHKQDMALRMKAAGKRGKELPATQAEKLGNAGALRASMAQSVELFDKIGPEAYGGASLIPFLKTDAKVWEALKERLAHQMARAAEGGRITDPDVERYLRGLPNATSSKALAKELFGTLFGESIAKLASTLSQFQQAEYDVTDQYNDFIKNFGVDPDTFLMHQTKAVQEGRPFDWESVTRMPE